MPNIKKGDILTFDYFPFEIVVLRIEGNTVDLGYYSAPGKPVVTDVYALSDLREWVSIGRYSIRTF